MRRSRTIPFSLVRTITAGVVSRSLEAIAAGDTARGATSRATLGISRSGAAPPPTRAVTSLVSTAGGVTVGHYAHLGTTCAVAENRTIAAGAQVAMGSVVLRDVPLGAFVLGNPARKLRVEEVDDDIVRLWEGRDIS